MPPTHGSAQSVFKLEAGQEMRALTSDAQGLLHAEPS
jgi:hypothetical protein